MSVGNLPASRLSVQYGGPVQGDMTVYVNAGVYDDGSMILSMRAPDDEAVSILFGKERVTLEFYDVESLERLCELAEEGAQRLRAAIELNERADAVDDAAADRPAADKRETPELVGAAGAVAP